MNNKNFKSFFNICLIGLTITLIISCSNNSKDRLPEDSIDISWNRYEEKYAEGGVKAVGFINDNKRVGEWQYFEKNGDLKATGSYTNGLKKGIWYYGKYEKDSIDWVIIHDKLKGYKINLPSRWSIFENYKNSGISAYFSNKTIENFNSNVNIQIINYDDNFDLDIEIKKLSNGYDKLTELRSININGLKGNYLNYTANNGRFTIQGLQVALQNEKQLVIISCFDLDVQFEYSNRLFNEITHSITFD